MSAAAAAASAGSGLGTGLTTRSVGRAGKLHEPRRVALVENNGTRVGVSVVCEMSSQHPIQVEGSHCKWHFGTVEMLTGTFRSLTGVGRRRVGDKDLRELVEVGLVTAGSSEGDRGAVHVELAVANAVNPGPGQDVLAGGDVVGNFELKTRVESGAGIVAVVAVTAEGAATLDRSDDAELGRGSGGGLVSQGDLAGAATMGSTTLEGELLSRSEGHCGGGATRHLALAGEVDAISKRTVLVTGERRRVGQEHVSIGGGNQAKDGSDAVEVHFEEKLIWLFPKNRIEGDTDSRNV